VLICLVLALHADRVAAQEQSGPTPQAEPAHPTEAAPAETPAINADGSPAQSDATDENEGTAAVAPATAPPKFQPVPTASANSGAALRNENVFAAKVDSESQKADNQRLGGSYQPVTQPIVEANFFAVEFGQSSSELGVLNRPAFGNAWHGEVFESLQNSVFNARSFFQAGPVMPSRMNSFGGRFSGRLPKWGFLSGNYGGIKNRGMVNGNALVPLPDERTPLATDPAVRDIVAHFLAAYPNELPNRTDIDPRMLNTNAPQRTDSLDATLRLDGNIGRKGMLSLSHNLNRQNIQAFQLVAGANPDTAIHSLRSRLTYRYIASPKTEFSLGAGFTRVRTDLHSAPGAVGPTVRVARVVDNLGPDLQYPINRAENTFRYGALGYHQAAGGRHRLTFGGDVYRYQLNGFEQNTSRGLVQFGNDFGRSSLENMLLGTPTLYQISIGNMYRGFRNWTTDVFFGDQWTVNSRLQIYMGVRHNLTTKPVEVNNLNTLPFHTDWNNFSPRFSLTLRGPKEWIARASYTVSFSKIQPVTYSQVRYNPPGAVFVTVNTPNLADPLAGIDLSAPNPRSSIIQFSPNLVDPYSHQYSFTLERRFGPAVVDLGYFGSRTIKLVNSYSFNRADPVPGIPLTTATINERRPDPNYYDVLDIVNGGIAYLDAAQASFRLASFHGIVAGSTYVFSKALDQGASYTYTAANKDLNSRQQWQYDALNDRKARSDFDSPHSFVTYFTYSVPKRFRFSDTLSYIAGNWQLSGVLTLKKGTPFNVNAGSDGPGYGNVDGIFGDRPNILDPSILGATVGNPNTSTQILNRSYFTFIQPGEHAGNLGYNAFRRDGIRNVNASVSREWRWGGPDRAYLLRFQADAYNLTNKAQFDAPQNNVLNPAFGKITNTLNTGRVLQLGLRLSL
jgi:hypothetical protein